MKKGGTWVEDVYEVAISRKKYKWILVCLHYNDFDAKYLLTYTWLFIYFMKLLNLLSKKYIGLEN